MKTIKLVIWDLDETFWDGVITEGGVTFRPEREAIVVELAKRGIISSICSKNDFNIVRTLLEEKGLWTYFIFPEIAFEAKGRLIRKIIVNCQLRDENVLFIDDNISNRSEAEHYCPGIQTADPKILSDLLEWPGAKGKPDPQLERLNQYKLMERRKEDLDGLDADHQEFLKRSNIRVRLIYDLQGLEDRVYDLVNRTNQLNYTKKRLTREEIDNLVKIKADGDIMAVIHVIDRYGDHGICGFVCVSNGVMDHFLFSCRILNLGIPSWTYNRLMRPVLEVVGEVSEGYQLDTDSVKHVLEVDQFVEDAQTVAKPNNSEKTGPKIAIVGGCDLEQVVRLLSGNRIQAEFAYVNNHGVHVHREHTEVLKLEGKPPFGAEEALAGIRVFDSKDFNSAIFEAPWDILVYSPLNDYSRGLYKNKKYGWVFPFDAFQLNWTDSSLWEDLPRHLSNIPRECFEALRDRFDFRGAVTPEEFIDNILRLGKRFQNRRIVFLNGAEVEARWIHSWERGMHLRHKIMNEALQAAVDLLPNASIIDVRPWVNSRRDVVDNIRHYKPRVFLNIAEEIQRLDGVQLEVGGVPVNDRGPINVLRRLMGAFH